MTLPLFFNVTFSDEIGRNRTIKQKDSQSQRISIRFRKREGGRKLDGQKQRERWREMERDIIGKR